MGFPRFEGRLVSVEAEHPDANVVRIMAKGIHDKTCRCHRWPCQSPFRTDYEAMAWAGLYALIAAGFEWVPFPFPKAEPA